MRTLGRLLIAAVAFYDMQVFSLKNPLHPEFTLTLDSGVVALHLHPEFPNLMAVGCYDGTVAVFDIRSGKKEPMYLSTARTGKHNDPVWSVFWQVDELLKSLQFCSVSTDGQVILWTLSKAELQLEVIMSLKAPGATPGPDGPVTMTSGSCCMDFCKVGARTLKPFVYSRTAVAASAAVCVCVCVCLQRNTLHAGACSSKQHERVACGMYLLLALQTPCLEQRGV